MNETIYKENGYSNREEYLKDLAYEYGRHVYVLADLLGPEEDFDDLIVSLENMRS